MSTIWVVGMQGRVEYEKGLLAAGLDVIKVRGLKTARVKSGDWILLLDVWSGETTAALRIAETFTGIRVAGRFASGSLESWQCDIERGWATALDVALVGTPEVADLLKSRTAIWPGQMEPRVIGALLNKQAGMRTAAALQSSAAAIADHHPGDVGGGVWYGIECEDPGFGTPVAIVSGKLTDEEVSGLRECCIEWKVDSVFICETFEEWDWLRNAMSSWLTRPVVVARWWCDLDRFERIRHLFPKPVVVVGRTPRREFDPRPSDWVSIGREHDMVTIPVNADEGRRTVPSMYAADRKAPFA